MDLSSAKHSVKALLCAMTSEDQGNFMKWIQSSTKEAILGAVRENSEEPNGDMNEDSYEESLLVLESIRQDLQDLLPPSCTLDSETITLPKDSDTCGGDAGSVQYVDSFVYDEDDLDIACTLGKFSRSYCTKCGSRSIKDLEFISHSFSVDQVKFIATKILDSHRGQVLLDIGSRTGALLYGAALLSPLKKSLGIEVNKEFADMSHSIVDNYNMADRVTIIHDDILNREDSILEADVIVMNNVFEFFTNKEEQKRLWKFSLDSIRKRRGATLITVPAVEKSLSNIGMAYDLSFLKSESLDEQIEEYWSVNASESSEINHDILHEIHLYHIV